MRTLLLASALFCAPVLAAPAPPNATPREIELGDKAAREFEKSPQAKLMKLDTPEKRALHTKLNAMARELGALSLRPGIKYRVNVIESPELNAFTLPNGHIYLFRGLLDAVGSDDEVAAVIAHEIGHNAKMHVLRGEAKAKKMTLANLAVVAAMIAGGQAGGNVGAFSQFAMIGIMNRYSVAYEKEADDVGIESMAKSRWNPSAMVTMMQRFERVSPDDPERPAGIFQSHPGAPERVQAAMNALSRLKVPFTPRKVSGGAQVQAIFLSDRAQVKLGNLVLCEFAATSATDASARKRADSAAQRINALLRDGLKLSELSTQTEGQNATLTARGQIIARATPRDAKLVNATPSEVVSKWRGAFQSLFWREQISGKFSAE